MSAFPSEIDIDYIFRDSLSYNSRRTYRKQFAHYMAYAQNYERAFDPAVIAAYRQHLIERTDAAVATIELRLIAIKRIARYLHEEGYLDRPAYLLIRDVEIPSGRALRHRGHPIRGAIPPEKIREICNLPEPTLSNPVPARDRALLLLLATTGIRVSEALRIQTEDIVRVGHGYEIRNIAPNGRAQVRSIPISDEVYEALHDWLYIRTTNGPYVFNQARVYNNGTILWNDSPMSSHAAERVVRTYGRMAGIADIKPFELRRFAGQQMAKHGVRVAQRLLGHTTLLSTAMLLSEETVEVPLVEF